MISLNRPKVNAIGRTLVGQVCGKGKEKEMKKRGEKSGKMCLVKLKLYMRSMCDVIS